MFKTPGKLSNKWCNSNSGDAIWIVVPVVQSYWYYYPYRVFKSNDQNWHFIYEKKNDSLPKRIKITNILSLLYRKSAVASISLVHFFENVLKGLLITNLKISLKIVIYSRLVSQRIQVVGGGR